jgi:ABC-type lipoprotein export system ATPase subunit
MTSGDAIEASAEQALTEGDAFADLLKWSLGRPNWQRDALRRLVQNGSLSETDFTELYKLCIDPKQPGQPLTAAHVSAEEAATEGIALLSVENAKAVNALVPNQKLQFAPRGLTVVYGDNGSGKSGYVRILKHACRTRDMNNKIVRNVQDTANTPQSATVHFSRGSAKDHFDWTPTSPTHSELPAVSIFDSRSASIHVEKTNAVAYIPQPMEILESLAAACDRISSMLDNELANIAARTPRAIKDHRLGLITAAGAFISNLSAKSNFAQLDLLTQISESERRRLAVLEADLAQDPERAAARINGQKTRLDDGSEKLRKLLETSSPSAFQRIESLRADRVAKEAAAKLAADELFSAAPLPGVGNGTWRALWEAARRFSNEVAYRDRFFPDPSGDGELCVLCLQPLEESAVSRRSTFERFVKSTTKVDEEAASRAYTDALRAASTAHIPISSIRQLVLLITAELGNTPLADEVRKCGTRAAWRLRALLRGKTAPCDNVLYAPEGTLKAASIDLHERARKLSANRASPEYHALVKELAELKAREALSLLAADVKAEIDRLGEMDLIKQAAKDTAKKPITTKNKDLSDKMVTNALRGRFSREIDKLRLTRMPVELRKIKDANAVSYFQVCLVEKPDQAVGEIFSEGEHRCVALAAFLAELATSKQPSAIVFDDPMSSLDHIHRRAVAARLVEESLVRQVIVFTHDLTFLFDLRRECEAQDRSIHYQTVCRQSNRPGFIEGELPTKAKSTMQLANFLRSELKSVRPHFSSQWNDSKRTLFAKGIIAQLRDAWDQGIADFISPVLGRFSNEIKGSTLYKLAVLTEDDVKTVTSSRGRLSEGLHGTAETINAETVTHDELVAEVGKLETWLQSIALRQKDARAPVTSYTR